jgi:hypothetical protein
MGKDDHKIIDTRGTGTSGKSDTSTETTSTEGKRGRGRPRKSESGSSGSKTATDIPKLVLVEDPAGEEEADQTPAAPKNPTKRKRKDIQYEIKKEQLAVLIKTTFDIVGSREGMEIWKLSQKEAELIAEPLSALMAKNPLVDKLTSQYGDWIALIIALGTIIVPRAFIMMATKKKEKKETVKPYVTINKANEKQGTDTKRISGGDQSGAAGTSNRQPDRQPSSASGNIGTKLHGIIPAIQ